MAKKKKTTKSKRTQPAKSAKTSRKVKHSRRSPVTIRDIRPLAIECETMAEAEVRLDLKTSLAATLKKHPKLADAWQRGRMLGSLRQLAATAVTITEAEASLGMEHGLLTKLIETDLEVADMWNQARMETIIAVKKALVESAKGGNPSACKQIESILMRELAHRGIDFQHLVTDQMIEITGRTRQTLHDWQTKHGLGRNSDKTFNLIEFFKWFENFAANKNSGKAKAAQVMDPLKAAKAERLEIDLKRQRNQLLDRASVMSGQLARHQSLVNSLERKPEELALVCHGCTADKITEILRKFFLELRHQQCQVPEQLRLGEKAEAVFLKLLESLSPEGQK